MRLYLYVLETGCGAIALISHDVVPKNGENAKNVEIGRGINEAVPRLNDRPGLDLVLANWRENRNGFSSARATADGNAELAVLLKKSHRAQTGLPRLVRVYD